MSNLFVSFSCATVTGALLIGCVMGGPALESELGTSEAALIEGTPDAVGVLALVNDPATTLEILDDDVRLDRRAAKSIVAARPIATLADLDALYWVGPQTLERLTVWAQNWGWVPKGDELLGSFEGVEFTVDEAAATLLLCNTASYERLDDTLALDARAAESIVTARPLASLAQLSDLYWIGRVHVENLKAYANASPPPQIAE